MIRTAIRQTTGLTARTPSLRFASTFANVPEGPPDPILGLTVAFKGDTDPRKVNLGVGAYRNDAGKPYVLESVREAEKRVLDMDMEYAGITGVPELVKAVPPLVFGEGANTSRVSSLQTISGTGALRLSGDFLNRFYTGAEKKVVYLPNPSWANHNPIFKDAGFEVATYTYYNPSNCGLNIEGMLSDIQAMPKGSIVLLHACAHNPTGVDPTAAQWKEIMDVVRERGHYPIVDMAYQGFASGDLEKDATAVRLLFDAGMEFMVCQSFAKNFGLYGHRCGMLHIVCGDEEEKSRVESQVKILVRPVYSNPPIHGGRIVSKVLEDPNLRALWGSEIKVMSNRINEMREALVKELVAAGSVRDWGHILSQIGMFSFTGLSKEQCQSLINDHHIYLTANGRISMAGVTSGNVEYIAKSIHSVTS